MISVHDDTNKILSCDSNCVVDVVMLSKFNKTSISVTEVMVTSI